MVVFFEDEKENMNRRDFEALKKELRLKAFPVRPRPLRHCGYRDGIKVFIRKRCSSSFQMHAKIVKPIISFELPPKHRGTKFPNRSFGLLVEELWDYVCDRLFS